MQLLIDRQTNIPLTRQVYQQIRAMILDGTLKSGDKLPSSRVLAVELNLSRNVILEAYELLTAEGYIEGARGSGTFVAPGASLDMPTFTNSPAESGISHSPPETQTGFIDFRSGIPALECFPVKKWANLTQRCYLEAPPALLGYDSPEGRYELRIAISRYVMKYRGIHCSPEQIIITSGSVQGLSLITQTLVSADSPVILEDPTNRDIERILIAPRATIYPVPADSFGIKTNLLPQAINPCLILVTPSHQFPLGGNLPVQRRIELVRYAHEHNSLIIEDDYDSEYRYDGPPVSSLHSLDPERVIYLGTFSKILFPGLRLGYMILPSHLTGRFRTIKKLADIHSNSLNQLVLAEFIQEGHLERHVAKMRKVYRKRRDTLIAALTGSFPGRVVLSGTSTGLHLIAEFAGIQFDAERINHLKENGVRVYPVEELAMVKRWHLSKIILGYGHLNEAEIIAGIEKLQKELA